MASDLPQTHSDHDGPKPTDGVETAPPSQQVDGGSAEQCLRRFHEMAAEGMRQEYVKNLAANEAYADQAVANGVITRPVSAADRRQADQDRREAQTELNTAYELRRNATTDAEHQEAQGLVDEATAARNEARERCRAMDAECAAGVGRRLESGSPQQNPRCPGGGTTLHGASRAGSPKPTSLF